MSATLRRFSRSFGFPAKAKLTVVIIGLFFLLVAARAIVAYEIPYNRFRNYDEFLTLQMAQAPLLGLPPMFLSWPAGPLRMVLPAALFGDLAVHGKKLSVLGLLEYLSEIDRHPWHVFWVMRWIVICVSTAGICSLVVPLMKRTGSLAAAIGGVVFIAAVPAFWQRSVMAMPDAIALALLCCSIACALGEESDTGGVGWSALLFGVAVATKITIFQAAPFVLLLALQHRRHRIRALWTWVLMVPVGFALGCPYGVAEPVRMLKSILGNLTMKEAGAQAAQAAGGPLVFQMWTRLTELLPVWILIFVLGAVGLAIWRRLWWEFVAMSAGFAASAILVLRSPAFTPFYLLPLAPVLLVFASLTLGIEIKRISASMNLVSLRLFNTGMGGIGVLILLAGARGVQMLDLQGAIYYQGLFDSLHTLQRDFSNERVIVCPFLIPLAASGASSASLLRLADQVESTLVGGAAMKEWLETTLRLPEQPARAMANHFTEYDRNLGTFLRVAAGSRAQPGYTLYIVGSRSDSSLARLGALSREEAFSWLREGKADALLMDARLEPDLPPGGTTFGTPGGHQYILYRADSSAR